MKRRISKIVTFVDETLTEQGRRSIRRPAARRLIAVIENPYAGKYEEDLDILDRYRRGAGRPAGRARSRRTGHRWRRVEGYGKAAAVGEKGELEHAAAILHPKFGTPFRKVLGKGAALIPSSKKRGGLGVVLDIPLGHKDAAYVRSHFDGMEVRINDAPRADEIMVAVAVTDCRPPAAPRRRTDQRPDQGRRWAEVICGPLLPLQKQCYGFVMLGTFVAGGVLRLRCVRTIPSMTTMPMPGRSPSRTLCRGRFRPNAAPCP